MEVLRAYLHPCLTEGRLFPVDSGYERTTFRVIDGLAEWILKDRHVGVTIEKPLFDIGPEEIDEEEAEDARVTCIPDFLLHVAAPVETQPPITIVETMGYGDDVYLDRKKRSHALMRAVLQNAPLLEHLPSQPELTLAFRKRLCAVLLEGIPLPRKGERNPS